MSAECTVCEVSFGTTGRFPTLEIDGGTYPLCPGSSVSLCFLVPCVTGQGGGWVVCDVILFTEMP